MSKKGYEFESETEDFFLNLTGQNKQTPMLRFDDKGLLLINRTFRVPNSGAMKALKGDIITVLPWLPQQFKVECKARYESTKKDGPMIVIEKEWITKNNEEAKNDNQIPILTFSFKRMKTYRVWWIIKRDDWVKLALSYPKGFSCQAVPVKYQLSEKKDKIKFVQNVLGSILLKQVWTFTEADLGGDYYLAPSEVFRDLLVGLKP